MSDPPISPGPVRSALRTLDLLSLLAQGGPMTHAALAVALGVPKSSLTLLLRTLAAEGYVVAEGRRWRCGPALARLVAVPDRMDLAALARPVVRRLSEAVEESAGFVVREGGMGRVLVSTVARHPLTYGYRAGQQLPLHATSWGKAMLAAMPGSQLDAWLAGPEREAFTPQTITGEEALRAEIERVRRTGLGRSLEERHPGIVGLGRVVAGPDGAVAGALNVALPSARHSEAAEARIVTALDEAAAALSARLRGEGRPC